MTSKANQFFCIWPGMQMLAVCLNSILANGVERIWEQPCGETLQMGQSTVTRVVWATRWEHKVAGASRAGYGCLMTRAMWQYLVANRCGG